MERRGQHNTAGSIYRWGVGRPLKSTHLPPNRKFSKAASTVQREWNEGGTKDSARKCGLHEGLEKEEYRH